VYYCNYFESSYENCESTLFQQSLIFIAYGNANLVNYEALLFEILKQ